MLFEAFIHLGYLVRQINSTDHSLSLNANCHLTGEEIPQVFSLMYLIHKEKTVIPRNNLWCKMNRSMIHRLDCPVPLTPFQFRPFVLADTFILIVHPCICKNEPNMFRFTPGIEVDKLVWWCHQLSPVIQEISLLRLTMITFTAFRSVPIFLIWSRTSNFFSLGHVQWPMRCLPFSPTACKTKTQNCDRKSYIFNQVTSIQS